jgi:3'(2'), 5'-bisphosphate nucleotidase
MNGILKIAITAALEAGIAILDVYQSDDFDVEIKGDNSPLTKADKVAHKTIVFYLEKTGIPIISEEGDEIPYEERKDWKELWIIDPLDGTKEFIKRNGEFTVNIALIQNQVPVLGVVFAPASGDLYFSQQGVGSFKLNIDLHTFYLEHLYGAKKLPLERKDSTYTIVASRSHMSTETESFIKDLEKEYGTVNTISKGSSLKLCMVAEGQANCYPRFAPTMEWDTAAGQAICMHAGFNVIDWNTKETMKYNREQLLNNWFLVN